MPDDSKPATCPARVQQLTTGNKPNDSKRATSRSTPRRPSHCGASEESCKGRPWRRNIHDNAMLARSVQNCVEAWKLNDLNGVFDVDSGKSPYEAWMEECTGYVRKVIHFNSSITSPRPASVADGAPVSPNSAQVQSPVNAQPVAEEQLDDATTSQQQSQETVTSEDSCSDSSGEIEGLFPDSCNEVVDNQDTLQNYDAVKIYRQCRFFKPCSLWFIRELLFSGGDAVRRGQTFDSGAIVYSEGDPGMCMYVVARGTAEVSSTTKSTFCVGYGGSFGDAQVLGVSSVREDTVRAKTSLHVLQVTCGALTRLLKKTPLSDLNENPATSDDKSVNKKPGHLERMSVMTTGMSKRCSQGSSLPYVFLEERHHFEREAVRIYHEQNQHHAQQVADKKDVCTADTNAAGSLVETPARRKQRTDGKELISIASAQRPKSHAVSSGLNVAHVSGLENPRQWRQQVERTQQILVEGKLQDIPARDRYIESLSTSIRSDMLGGQMMPPDSAFKKRRSSFIPPSTCKDSSGRRLTGTGRHRKGTQKREEPMIVDAARHALDFQLLPPMKELSPMDKHTLLQLLQKQAKLAKNRQAQEIRARTMTTGLGRHGCLAQQNIDRSSGRVPTTPPMHRIAEKDAPLQV